MNGRIIIFLGLLVFALAADGESTFQVPSGPEVPMEQKDNSGGSGGFKCYSYECGEKFAAEHSVKRIECKDKSEKTVICDTGICTRQEVKGALVYFGAIDQVVAKCAEAGSPKTGCVDLSESEKSDFKFTGNFKTCYCSTELCNGSSVSSRLLSSPSLLLSLHQK